MTVRATRADIRRWGVMILPSWGTKQYVPDTDAGFYHHGKACPGEPGQHLAR
jgi:hypothetical protein